MLQSPGSANIHFLLLLLIMIDLMFFCLNVSATAEHGDRAP